MWQLHQKATRFHRPPSELLHIEDEWCAYCLDNAVNFFGVTLENALQERNKVGTGANVEYEPRYQLSELLKPEFRLPRQNEQSSAGAQLRAMAGLRGRGGVKIFKPKNKPGQELRPQ